MTTTRRKKRINFDAVSDQNASESVSDTRSEFISEAHSETVSQMNRPDPAPSPQPTIDPPHDLINLNVIFRSLGLNGSAATAIRQQVHIYKFRGVEFASDGEVRAALFTQCEVTPPLVTTT